ncbi:hypothetical protein AAIR29_01690 [Psychrobacter sp. FBL11]|uniref:Uncharacterized protein n=1 Tax=Psychrobacter saeujeotis TaxID=3143436 RepID=A0ABU9X4P4_9GAMM|nr:hypothetical protein [uncultured Psychrobacter sp.]
MLHTSQPTDSLYDNIYHSISDFDFNIATDENMISALAFASLPLVIQESLLQSERIILIANNPSIDTASLEALLRPTDMLVLFNDFIHADFFAHHPLAKGLPKLLFFRQIGDSKLHFGLPPRSNNLTAMLDMAKQAPLGILFGNTDYKFPLPSDDPSPHDDPITVDRVLEISEAPDKLLRSDEYCRVLSEQHEVVADYPIFADIHSSAPTSGFLLYRLLLSARLHIQQKQNVETPLSIIMLGFNNDDKTAHFWEGHNWAFERQELATPPRDVEIIRQY